jgi:hypothetical protein
MTILFIKIMTPNAARTSEIRGFFRKEEDTCKDQGSDSQGSGHLSEIDILSLKSL